MKGYWITYSKNERIAYRCEPSAFTNLSLQCEIADTYESPINAMCMSQSICFRMIQISLPRSIKCLYGRDVMVLLITLVLFLLHTSSSEETV